VELAGIDGEIEADGAVSAEYHLLVAMDDGALAGERREHGGVDQDRARRAGLAEDFLLERAAAVEGVRGEPEEVEERGGEIDGAADCVLDAGRRAGQAHDQGDADLFLVEREAVATEAVLAERLAVIGGHDDRGLVGEALSVELLEHLADDVVGVRHLAVVEPPARLGAGRKVAVADVLVVRIDEVCPAEEGLAGLPAAEERADVAGDLLTRDGPRGAQPPRGVLGDLPLVEAGRGRGCVGEQGVAVGRERADPAAVEERGQRIFVAKPCQSTLVVGELAGVATRQDRGQAGRGRVGRRVVAREDDAVLCEGRQVRGGRGLVACPGLVGAEGIDREEEHAAHPGRGGGRRRWARDRHGRGRDGRGDWLGWPGRCGGLGDDGLCGVSLPTPPEGRAPDKPTRCRERAEKVASSAPVPGVNTFRRALVCPGGKPGGQAARGRTRGHPTHDPQRSNNCASPRLPGVCGSIRFVDCP
jgi:hypothetical protein